MSITYRMNGRYVEVLQPDGTWWRPLPPKADQDLFDRQVLQWAPLALEQEERTGVPASYQLATVLSESGGDPTLLAADGGTGLNMITARGLFQNHSRQEALDPALNMQLAADFERTNMSTVGFDVPKLASMFNGGASGGQPHPNPNAPWGFHEYRIPSTGAYPYITRVVAVNNYAVDKLEGLDVQTSSVGDIFGVVAAGVGVGLGILIGRHLAMAASGR